MDLAKAFAKDFPEAPHLVAVLSKFTSQGSAYRALEPILAPNQAMRVIVWLLQRDIVERVRTYLRLIATEHVKKSAVRSWSQSLAGPGESSTTTTMSTSLGEGRAGTSASMSTSGGGGAASVTGSLGESNLMRVHSSTSVRTGGSSSSAARSKSSSMLKDVEEMAIVGTGLSSTSPRVSSPMAQLQARSMTTSASSQSQASSTGGGLATTGGFSVPGGGSGQWRRRAGMAGKSASSRGMSSNASNDSGGSASLHGATATSPNVDMAKSSIIREPGRPSEMESRWMAAMSHDVDPAIVENFEK